MLYFEYSTCSNVYNINIFDFRYIDPIKELCQCQQNFFLTFDQHIHDLFPGSKGNATTFKKCSHKYFHQIKLYSHSLRKQQFI